MKAPRGTVALLLCAGLLLPAGRAAAESLESAKSFSGLSFAEGRARPGESAPVDLSGAGAAKRALAAPLQASGREEVPQPGAPAKPRHDGYGSKRMIALGTAGYVAGFAASAWYAASVGLSPFLLLLAPIGAAYMIYREVKAGHQGKALAMAAVRGAVMGLVMGPPLAGAWLGFKISDAIDRWKDRRGA